MLVNMRVLGRVRLSRTTDESTSVERQQQIITQWAEGNNHTIVGWAIDVDVSGSINPFDTPSLGPWLTMPKAREWDILCAWKLDRVARNSIGLHKVFGWIQENEKQLVCIADNIDLSTWVGRLIASVIAGVAEGELEAITERNKAANRTLRANGRWQGGAPPYGYKIKDTGHGKVLEKNPDEWGILKQIIYRVLAGESVNSIKNWLIQSGLPTAAKSRYGKDTVWTASVVRGMLTSKHLLGYQTLQRKPVLDAEGKPILVGPPLISLETYNQIQEELNSRTLTTRNQSSGNPLKGVIKCGVCGGSMALRSRESKTGKFSGSYVCLNNDCTNNTIHAAKLLATVSELLEEELGQFEIMEKHTEYAGDTTLQLKEAEESYKEVAEYLPNAPTKESRQVILEQLQVIGKRIKALKHTPMKDITTWKSLGKTYGETWKEADNIGKQKLLQKAGIIVKATGINSNTGPKPGIFHTELVIPPDLKQRLGK